MNKTIGLFLSLSFLMVAGCGEASPETRFSAQAENTPWGRFFLSIQVTENGQPRPLVEGTRIRLDFADDRSRLGANAGCNHLGGQAKLDGDRLVVDDLATTEMGCDPARHAQDEWLGRFLTSRPTWRLDGPDLTLANDSTEIRLQDREVADPDRPLRDTRWVVESVIQRDTVSSVPRGADAYIVLRENNGFGGSTGCNQMGGTATVAPDTITFADVITTKMACEPDRMDLERQVLAVLDGEVTYEIEADVLRLRHPSEKGLDLRASSS